MAVKETEVTAVEAIEGIDHMIERAGEPRRRGQWMLVTVAKPMHDMRFDVPPVDPKTMAKLRQHGGSALVIEEKTVIVDREKMVVQADAAGIVILAKGRGVGG